MEIRDAAAFLAHLDAVHGRTRRVVLRIPTEHLERAPAPGRWTPGDLVRHLAGIERWMYAETVQGRPSRYPGHGRALADGFAAAGADGMDAVVALYDAWHAESRAIFASLSPDDLQGRSTTPAGAAITTWKWLRLMLEHEAHHRGQLYLQLALLGVPTPPLYGLTEEEVRARSAG